MAANTWNLLCSNVQHALNQNHLGLLNGGARVIRVYRIGLMHHITAVSGTLVNLILRFRYPDAAYSVAPTAVTPVPHDTANSALDTITAGYGGTITSTSSYFLRSFVWSTEEAVKSTISIDEWQCNVPLNIIWDEAYGESEAQFLTVRHDEAVHLYCGTNSTAGYLDTWMEFSDEAS